MHITSTTDFLTYWQKIQARTRRVVCCIPPERLEWSPREGMWTLGDLARHLVALEREMFAENVHGRPSRYQGCGEELASGYQEVLAYFDRVGAETGALIGELDDQRLQERCETPGGASITVWKWLRAMVEHHVHHRAQIYTYLSLLGVETPPLYGLSSEEVAERSVR